MSRMGLWSGFSLETQQLAFVRRGEARFIGAGGSSPELRARTQRDEEDLSAVALGGRWQLTRRGVAKCRSGSGEFRGAARSDVPSTVSHPLWLQVHVFQPSSNLHITVHIGKLPDPPCTLPAVDTLSSSPSSGRAFIFRALSLRSKLICVPRVKLPSSSGSPRIRLPQLASLLAVADMGAGIDQRTSS